MRFGGDDSWEEPPDDDAEVEKIDTLLTQYNQTGPMPKIIAGIVVVCALAIVVALTIGCVATILKDVF